MNAENRKLSEKFNSLFQPPPLPQFLGLPSETSFIWLHPVENFLDLAVLPLPRFTREPSRDRTTLSRFRRPPPSTASTHRIRPSAFGWGAEESRRGKPQNFWGSTRHGVKNYGKLFLGFDLIYWKHRVCWCRELFFFCKLESYNNRTTAKWKGGEGFFLLLRFAVIQGFSLFFEETPC